LIELIASIFGHWHPGPDLSPILRRQTTVGRLVQAERTARGRIADPPGVGGNFLDFPSKNMPSVVPAQGTQRDRRQHWR
jgi:hypothetical protein